MYVALVAVVLGQAALLGSNGLVAYAGLLLVLFHLRVVTYEEPQLEKLFGSEFAAYRQGVPRWIPRLPAWNGVTAGMVEQSADRRTRG
jgi:protein-S-isoprenylcysteine O-methyltransferase Ste14